jgi:hypothetical protein
MEIASIFTATEQALYNQTLQRTERASRSSIV